ncbi:hypothetical protein KDJ21_017785 [Metabacillus litoralis]|uniref:hypothetical protein n=1 Tax=Metabacillus TaxID=2675233 RepID=UPI001B8E1D0F|nr:hypothetical protein [Metabacillus litoralis]MCM3163500.1 hypothetical protein [Metabacillus litoralis]MCM3409771.1 hypothetical protein [Metabacillus litoralis]UHA58671.1 hypothetical protein KDJ21_017785 [Metabacillus litoralis]
MQELDLSGATPIVFIIVVIIGGYVLFAILMSHFSDRKEKEKETLKEFMENKDEIVVKNQDELP